MSAGSGGSPVGGARPGAEHRGVWGHRLGAELATGLSDKNASPMHGSLLRRRPGGHPSSDDDRCGVLVSGHPLPRRGPSWLAPHVSTQNSNRGLHRRPPGPQGCFSSATPHATWFARPGTSRGPVGCGKRVGEGADIGAGEIFEYLQLLAHGVFYYSSNPNYCQIQAWFTLGFLFCFLVSLTWYLLESPGVFGRRARVQTLTDFGLHPLPHFQVPRRWQHSQFSTKSNAELLLLIKAGAIITLPKCLALVTPK